MSKYFKLAINIPSIIWGIAKWFSIAWIENFINPSLEKFSEITGIPMQILEGIIIGGLLIGSIIWLIGMFWKKPSNNAEKDHKYYVAKKIVDAKADSLLGLSDALQSLSELDIRLLNEKRMKKVSNQMLINIQNRLKVDWNMKSSDTYDNLTIQTIQDVINKTIKDNHLELTKEDKETMLFMLHVAGVLDDEGVGLSKRREKDESYSLVNKLKAKAATDNLRDAIRFYIWYSLGMNSMLLLISIFPANSVQSMMKALGKTSAELKEERDSTLSHLLSRINALAERELHGK